MVSQLHDNQHLWVKYRTSSYRKTKERARLGIVCARLGTLVYRTIFCKADDYVTRFYSNMRKYTCAWVRILFVEQMKLCFFDFDYLNSLRKIWTCGLRLTGSNSYQLSYYILSCLKKYHEKDSNLRPTIIWTQITTTTDLKKSRNQWEKKCSKFFTKKKIFFF